MNTMCSKWWAFMTLMALVCACSGADKLDLSSDAAAGSAGSAQQQCPGQCPSPQPGAGGSSGTGGSSGSAGAGGSVNGCIPGQQISCPCATGTGFQVCKSDQTYDVCQCPEAGAAGQGGSSGSGGSVGTGGSSGTGGCTGGAGGSSATGGSGGSSNECVPGEQDACSCNGQPTGIKVCQSNGFFGTCQCPATDAGAGGNAGTGGSSGSAGAGGSSGSSGAGGTSTGGSAGSGNGCVPGEQETCSCSGQPTGIKVCQSNGTFGVCQCPATDAGVDAEAGSDAGSDADAAATKCTPNQDYPCACLGGVQSTQKCSADGQSFGPCGCSDAGAGGSGGSGGSSGMGGSGGSAGTGGSTGTVVTVTCEITHPDNTLNKTGTMQQHTYRVFVSDEGVDGKGQYATQTHVTWGQDVAPVQLGRSVKFTIATTLGSELVFNAARDPVGSDPAANGFWREPAISETGQIMMKIDCSVLHNGVVSHVAWPIAKQNIQKTSWNGAFYAKPTAITADDLDGDGKPNSQDCAPNNYYVAPGLAEVMENGVDEDCNGKDRKYVRYLMLGPSSLEAPMYATDWSKFVPLTFIHDQQENADYWATNFLPPDQLPTAFLIEYVGTCSGTHCWDCADLGTCVQTYQVKAQTTEIVPGSNKYRELPVTLPPNDKPCRRHCDPFNQ